MVIVQSTVQPLFEAIRFHLPSSVAFRAKKAIKNGFSPFSQVDLLRWFYNYSLGLLTGYEGTELFYQHFSPEFQVIFLGTSFFLSHFCFKSIWLHFFESSSIILCNGLGLFCFVLALSPFNSWKVDLKKRILWQNVCCLFLLRSIGPRLGKEQKCVGSNLERKSLFIN